MSKRKSDIDPTTTFPRRITIGAKYGPAMEIAEQAEADAYFERCVLHTLLYWDGEGPVTREKAEALERTNLGYYAGYYGTETRARVERLFKCAHPYFGTIAENGTPSPETAFNIGAAIGGAAKAGAR
jgi:hypothetical protein